MSRSNSSALGPRGRRSLGVYRSLVALACLAILILPGCRPPDPPRSSTESPSSTSEEATEETKPEEKARRVEVEAIRQGSVRDTITLSTTLEAHQTVNIPTRVSGVVDAVRVRPGDRVTAGTVLLAVEPRDLELAVEEQRLAHADAVEREKSAILDWEESKQTEQIRGLSAERAEREHQRFEGLMREAGRRAISEEDLERTRFARDEAKIALESARLATRRFSQAKQLAKIAVDRAKAAWDRAQLNLDRAEIKSPIDGSITFLEIRPGEPVSEGTHLATVVDRSELYCTVRVPQRRLADLRLGLEVEIEAETHPGRIFPGEVEALIPLVDRTEGTVEVRVRVDDANGELVPGAFLSARLILSERPDALLVSKRARLFEGNRSYLFVVRGDRAERITVQTGLLTTDAVEILPSAGPDSLAAGDAVVIRGQSRLRDGELVSVADPNAPTEPPVESEGEGESPTPEQTADRSESSESSPDAGKSPRSG